MTHNPHDEVWRPIPSLPGYEASSAGRIRSLGKVTIDRLGRRLRWPGRILAGCVAKNGRRKIGVGGGKYRKAAQLICEAFHGPRPTAKHECLHIDEDCSNDRPANLKWGTKHENMSAPKLVEQKRQKMLAHWRAKGAAVQ